MHIIDNRNQGRNLVCVCMCLIIRADYSKYIDTLGTSCYLRFGALGIASIMTRLWSIDGW